MNFKAATLSALIALSWSPIAAAGPVVDAATRAEALQGEGKSVEALDALEEAVDAIWREGPLAFRRIVLVNSSSGYGIYSERKDRVFRPDDKMLIHVEPVGYGYRAPGASSTIGFTADLAIENMTGQVLGEAENVFSISAPSGAKKREFSMTLSFGVPYYRPGEYKAVFTVHDQNSAKSGTFEVPFTIALPAESAAPTADAGESGG